MEAVERAWWMAQQYNPMSLSFYKARLQKLRLHANLKACFQRKPASIRADGCPPTGLWLEFVQLKERCSGRHIGRQA